LAEDVTVEADSAGHTDNRPMAVLVPLMTQLRDELARSHDLQRLPRIGAAGGIGTPTAVAGAFALGAAYVVTGSINEASLEAGISPAAKDMLAKADIADVMMAPAADMFELGVKLQVLKRGTMFAVRAAKLWELYSAHASLEALPQVAREKLEREILGLPIDAVWADTRGFFMKRDPSQVERAEREPRHRMALVFRWYLGKASRWAIDGDPTRRLDYQIWCGPAMGAFNAWTAGSFLAAPAARGVVDIARCLLEGAAAVTRAHQLRTAGITVSPGAFTLPPRQLQGVA